MQPIPSGKLSSLYSLCVKKTFLEVQIVGSRPGASRRTSSAPPRSGQLPEGAPREPPQGAESAGVEKKADAEGERDEEGDTESERTGGKGDDDQVVRRPCKSKRKRCTAFLKFVEKRLDEDPLSDVKQIQLPVFINCPWMWRRGSNSSHLGLGRASITQSVTPPRLQWRRRALPATPPRPGARRP